MPVKIGNEKYSTVKDVFERDIACKAIKAIDTYENSLTISEKVNIFKSIEEINQVLWHIHQNIPYSMEAKAYINEDKIETIEIKIISNGEFIYGTDISPRDESGNLVNRKHLLDSIKFLWKCFRNQKVINIRDKKIDVVEKDAAAKEKQIIVGQCPKSGDIIVRLAGKQVIPTMKLWLFFEISEPIKFGFPGFTPRITQHWLDVAGYDLQKKIVLAIMGFLAEEEIKTSLLITFSDGENVKIYSDWDNGYFSVGHNLEEAF